MHTPDEVVDLFKHYLSNDMKDHTLNLLQEVASDIRYKNNHEYIFQKIYLFCCLTREKDLLLFLYNNIYRSFDVVKRIALRPCIIYGKYLYKDGYPIELPKDPALY
jgi:hypothetical protein